MNTIKIQIPSLPENIKIIESFIDNAKESYKFNDDIYGNVMIAVTEAVNNAIFHGNKEDKNKKVTLTLELHEDEINFKVEDEGPGFDPESLPDPTAPENLEKPGGRGIFIIKNLADKYKFENEGRLTNMTFTITRNN